MIANLDNVCDLVLHHNSADWNTIGHWLRHGDYIRVAVYRQV